MPFGAPQYASAQRSQSIKDGDGDGVVFDGTPQERPAPKHENQLSNHESHAVTQTPEFKQWFEGSKIVNQDGSPKVLFHGTYFDFEKFDDRRLGNQSEGVATAAFGHWFFDNARDASFFQKDNPNAVVMRAFARVRKPYVMEEEEFLQYEEELEVSDGVKFRNRLKSEGYDGVIVPSMQWIAVFQSEDIWVDSSKDFSKSVAISAIFTRAMEMKMSHVTFKAAGLKDGDGDGLIFDGTPQQQPAPRKHTVDKSHPGVKPSEDEAYYIGGLMDKIERMRPDEVPWSQEQTLRHESLRKVLKGDSLTKVEHAAAVGYLHNFYNDSRGSRGLGDPFADRKLNVVASLGKKLGIDVEAEWMKKNPGARPRRIYQPPVRREWGSQIAPTTKSLMADSDMSGNQRSAISFFQRAQSLKAIGKIGMSPVKKKRGGPGQEIDGDGDGVIYDGTAQERPVVRRMPQGLKPEPGTVPAMPKLKPKPPVQQAQPVTPTPAPKPKPQPKPSPMQKQREAAGKEAKPPKPPKAAIVDPNTGEQISALHTVKPKTIDKAKIPPMAKAAIHNAAATMTPQRCSELAKLYEDNAAEVWRIIPISRDKQDDAASLARIKGDDDYELYFKKAKEFDEKAALWAHYAENPADAQKPIDIKTPPQKSFNELVPLKTSEDIDFGQSSGVYDWDELDSYTQRRVKNDWVNDRMRDSDFLNWVGESTREGIDTEELIRENLDELLPQTDWDKLDVGQREVADQIEQTVKEAMKNGLKIGKEMTPADLESIRKSLLESSLDWKNGDLDDATAEQLVDLATASLNQSEPGVVNIPGEDDIAEILQIDDDDAVSQLYEIWKRGRSEAINDLIDNEVESRMSDDDTLQEYAEMEWDNMDDDAMLQAAKDHGHAEEYSEQSSTISSPELRELGIEDAASFVGAPDGSTVTVDGTTINVEGRGDLYMKREISQGSIYSSNFNAGSRYKGEGAQIFAQMVRQAREAGFMDISVTAAGELGGGMNGYYTWPLVGYEADIDDVSERNAIRQNFPGVETMQDLFDTPGGRDWWFVNGSTLSMDFDLSDGSRNMKVLERYMNEKANK
jgi:hypothetical protein